MTVAADQEMALVELRMLGTESRAKAIQMQMDARSAQHAAIAKVTGG